MTPYPYRLAALTGSALIAAGCATAPASGPGAADMNPKPATPATVRANQAM